MQRQQKNILYRLVHISNCISLLSRTVLKPKGSWLQWLQVVPIIATFLHVKHRLAASDSHSAPTVIV